MLNAGDFAQDRMSDFTVQVLERIAVWGYVSYKVFNPSTGQVYMVSEDQLDIESASIHYDENYLRYVVLLSKIKNETAGGILTSLSNGIIPLPHQLHVLNRVMQNNRIRYLLADEVGLGKTIEAGMIVKELKARGLVQRTLVVCPTGLVTQWASEMQNKFHEKFQVILPSDYDTIRRLTDNNDVYGQYDQVISPMDSIKPIEKHSGWTDDRIMQYNQDRINSIINSGWDLIIIDEAHRVAGSSGDVARYKLGRMLSQASPYLLLLTATPHSGKTEPFLRLVRLLDEEAFPNAKSIVKNQVAPYLIRTEKRDAIDNKGDKLFKNRVTNLMILQWDQRHTLQKELYQKVSRYVAKTYNKALRNKKKNMCLIFLLIIMQRMVVSSTTAVKQSLQRRLEVLSNQQTHLGMLSEADLDELNIEDNVRDALESLSLDISEEMSELETLIAIAKQAEYQHPDVKLEKLDETLDAIFTEDCHQKVIIFTEFVATQYYLQGFLTSHGYRVTIINGGLSMEERDEALQEFRVKTDIFISTDAGGEGLNLQFANIIINYDLPWNPMKIEQRCGRVDRIGQTRDVQVFNFIVGDTIENRVREVLEEKLSVILEEMGVDKYSDVLDSEIAEVDFTDVYMSSIASPSSLEQNIRLVQSDMRQQLNNDNRYRSIIKEDKDLTSLVGKDTEFDVNAALKQMVAYYEQWKCKDLTILNALSIMDEEIVRHLKADVIHDKKVSTMHVSIQNFPNEAGYFMLWTLSIMNVAEGKRTIPVFINDDYILRPMAGKRIMDVFLDPSSQLCISNGTLVDKQVYDRLEAMSVEFAYDTFIEMRDKRLQQNEESYRKYMYALKLRMEAAENIGIENIRKSRLSKLKKEKLDIETVYRKGQSIYPDIKLALLVRLEA